MAEDQTETRAKNGDIDALLELGARHAAEGRVKASRGCFATAARAGSVVGLRLLGINLLSLEPVESEAGVNMMRAAADKGDAEAARICANIAAGDINLPDRAQVARQCLEIAAERGSELAREQIQFLDTSALDVDLAALKPHVVFESPRITVIERFATFAECDWIMERARPHLQRATLYNPHAEGFVVGGVRTNSAMGFDIGRTDVVFMGLRVRIQRFTGIDRPEAPSVLHYTPGQEFKPHFDFLDQSLPGYALDVERGGQRAATFLIYLNDDYEGGETDFPKLEWRYKGRKGDALFFWNLDPAGKPDRKTLHAGLPPTSGEKWLFSQWLRLPPPKL